MNKPASTIKEISARSLGVQPRSAVRPIQIWAFLGGAILAFQLYVWGKWITGPYFVEVPRGLSDPPLNMKTALIVGTSVLIVAQLVSIYYFLVRPWRRERRITTDGMLLVAFGLMFFQDPLLNYFNTWCTYNTWMFNRGSWVLDIPGWNSWGEPGRMMPEPLLMNMPGYSIGILLMTLLGCWAMRRTKARWPNISNLGLFGVLFVFTFCLDFILEGMILMPMGLFTYPGAIRSLSINAGTYYQWPLYEGLMWGGVQAGLCSLRYFTDDRGRTFVERGLEQIQGGFVKQQLMRFLAIFAACSLFFLLIYNVPAQWFAMHADSWPEDISKRSYFTMGVCGDGTDRACPDPSLPIQTRYSAYITPEGKLVFPKGVSMPKVVPIERASN